MVYFDNAATTRLDPQLIETIKKYSVDEFYNASAIYKNGVNNKIAINSAREVILKTLGALDQKLVFTSSGSEADNLAIFGSIKQKGSTIICSEIEHSAVFKPMQELSNRGFNLRLAKVDSSGRVSIDALSKMLDEKVSFVSIMHVSNETGAINDIQEIAKIIRKKSPKAIFHCDGVQAYCKIKVNVKQLDVDAYSISAHKIHGPKGIGALYYKKNINLKPQILGGNQEFGLRSSTENVAAIAAFSQIAEKMIINRSEYFERVKDIRDYFIEKAKENLQDLNLITDIENNSSPYIICCAVKSVKGETLLHELESKGILIGIGSACTSNANSTKRIPIALKLEGDIKDSIIRISFSHSNTKQEVDILIDELKAAIEKLSHFKRK